jgi:hypothetical protein
MNKKFVEVFNKAWKLSASLVEAFQRIEELKKL